MGKMAAGFSAYSAGKRRERTGDDLNDQRQEKLGNSLSADASGAGIIGKLRTGAGRISQNINPFLGHNAQNLFPRKLAILLTADKNQTIGADIKRTAISLFDYFPAHFGWIFLGWTFFLCIALHDFPTWPFRTK